MLGVFTEFVCGCPFFLSQLFFHKFFSLRKRSGKASGKPRRKHDDDDEMEDDGEDEEDSADGSVLEGSGDGSDEEEEAKIWQVRLFYPLIFPLCKTPLHLVQI